MLTNLKAVKRKAPGRLAVKLRRYEQYTGRLSAAPPIEIVIPDFELEGLEA
jgi:hypothetical protein